MNNNSFTVNQVSDTAFLVAVYRALESERQDAHFYDPFARILAGDRIELITRNIPQKDLNLSGGAFVTRTYIYY